MPAVGVRLKVTSVKIDSRAFVAAVKTDPRSAASIAAVGNGVADTARTIAAARNTNEANLVAAEIHFKDTRDFPTRAKMRARGVDSLLVGLVVADHPASVRWEFGTASRAGIAMIRTAALAAIAGTGVRGYTFGPAIP